MELSKQNRIIILLIIDSAFFLLEIVAGYSVHSLALVADSFHMLNDVMSLVVALYALRLVNSKKSPKRLSYGYIRAEIVGALINGVFLLALCFTIFLSALERFFEPKEITDANLVLIVGSAGIVSNILGLLLFHEHGHSHGHAHGHSHDNSHDPVTKSLTDSSEPSSPIDVPEIFVHPARSRQSIVEAAHPAKGQSIIEGPDDFGIVSPSDSASSSSVSSDVGNKYDDINIAETTEPHCGNIQDNNMASRHSNISEHGSRNSYDSSHSRSRGHSHGHGSKKHAHRHRSLNMHGVFLHVLGDFLGNIGVVATALFIKLTTYSWRFYMDPVISLVITVIIFSSALPLVRA
jgi:zinc transporter 1